MTIKKSFIKYDKKENIQIDVSGHIDISRNKLTIMGRFFGVILVVFRLNCDEVYNKDFLIINILPTSFFLTFQINKKQKLFSLTLTRTHMKRISILNFKKIYKCKIIRDKRRCY